MLLHCHHSRAIVSKYLRVVDHLWSPDTPPQCAERKWATNQLVAMVATHFPCSWDHQISNHGLATGMYRKRIVLPNGKQLSNFFENASTSKDTAIDILCLHWALNRSIDLIQSIIIVIIQLRGFWSALNIDYLQKIWMRGRVEECNWRQVD